VSISTTGIISVKDSLINEGTLINNGNMVVGGTWLNLGTYNAGEGQITFNSTDTSIPQVINHNSQSISKLVISGGGAKQILADLTVVGSLTLTDGIIIAQNGSKVHFSSAAVISGGSDDSHINAPVYQQGTGTKLFPVGNGTTYLPVAIEGITTNSEIGITLTELQTGETLNVGSSLGDISDKRYWAVDLASGSLTGTKITLPVEGDEGLDALKNNEFVVAFSENTSGDFVSIGRSLNSTAALIQNEQSLAEGLVTLAVPSENQSIVVFNAISPNPNDEINDYIHIDNLLETDVVSIYNRWGDMVFEMKQYNNDDVAKRFNGQSNVGGEKDLPVGNYFYVIRRKAGKEVSGYLSLRK
jgi:gliding motility-associated-like protein